MSDLILLRHGESEWNRLNLFTGWYDCDLTDTGRAEASAAGATLLDAGLGPTVLHTSLQKRAIRTAQLALDTANLMWLPVRRSWRLNERHYGDLTGRNKAETTEMYGEEQVKIWRRSYDIAPPAIGSDNETNPNDDAQYASLPADIIPAAECLKDVVARLMPYWFDSITTDLAAGHTVLVVAHGNSLRALVKHLDSIEDADITELNIPTGIPLHYELGDDFRPREAKPTSQRYLGDADAIAAKAAAVAAQATAK
ncbi:MAG: 2,3-diphosphoglycerate-dependent phosphoglycerate mutase [Microthrixaceae bacterium]|nr:2,3-diphosphoglycerate-dependent phosphoglycerate mutase [Microthrixaceae bacterium]MCO5311737.1 2,3-diphosphoglycerate-dependent phosphoglycerate mutase [Microthrixaceae bacterium]HPB46003.1 2,3-diphosphoglycerate-dependent phosphoglycerate mutase [Microthrixaceae bacterium]